MNSSDIGTLLVVSGPSGSGKTTLCRKLADQGRAHYSISCTTRVPREGERDGADYHFLTRDSFQQKIQNDDFLEWAEVHGNFYGTLKSEALTYIEKGQDVIMDIDVQGAEQVRACTDERIRKSYADLFVMPATKEELRLRLTGRGTDAESVIELRMQNAMAEIACAPRYQFQLHSTTREADFESFSALFIALRLRSQRFF